MKFNDKAEVYTASGQKLGDIGQVILDPRTSAVIHIVVHMGWYFTVDKIIPVGDIYQALQNRATLRASAKIDEYQDFLQTDFVPFASKGELPELPAWYPPFWNEGA